MINELKEQIECEQTSIIVALDHLKSLDEDHAVFYEKLKERQAEIVRDLEEMLSEK